MDGRHVLAGFDGSPASRAVLRSAPWEARLPVVGDRGIGASPQTPLGAVARAVPYQAPGPVAVVHERDPDVTEPPDGGGTEVDA